MVSVIILRVIMLSVSFPSVCMLSVSILSVIILKVAMPNAECRHAGGLGFSWSRQTLVEAELVNSKQSCIQKKT